MARPPRRKPSAKSSAGPSQRPSRGSGRSGDRSRGGNSRGRDRDSYHRGGQGPDRDEADAGPDQRLQKVLAGAGIGSRRDCEEYIREGRVEVDRKVVTELGTKVDPLRQEIRVDGEALRQPKRLYFAINKPEGVVTTNYDPTGRPRVIDLVPTDERVFAVGRLDRASEGLILVTNDGEFANRITHPRYGVEKTYLVRVAGMPLPADLAKLQKGVYLSDGFCRVQSITVKSKHGRSTDLLMVLNEGRNRELRRVLAKVGHKVLRLKRIAVGSIKLGDLEPGAWRKLLPAEIEGLLALAREKRKATKSKNKKASKSSGEAKPVVGIGGETSETSYVQKQALLAQPLSLADLLQDEDDDTSESKGVQPFPAGAGSRPAEEDLDDDALAAEWPEGDDDELAISSADFPTDRPGEVLAYDEDEAPAPRPAGKPPGGKPGGRARRDKPPRYAPARGASTRGGKPRGGRPGAKPGGKPVRGKPRAMPSGGSEGRPPQNRSGGKPGGGRPGSGRSGSSSPSSSRPNSGRSSGEQPRGSRRGAGGPSRSGPPAGRPPSRGEFGKPGGKRKGRR